MILRDQFGLSGLPPVCAEAGDLGARTELTWPRHDLDDIARMSRIFDAILRADRQMLVQAMANLLQNALMHGGNDVTHSAQGAQIGVTAAVLAMLAMPVRQAAIR